MPAKGKPPSFKDFQRMVEKGDFETLMEKALDLGLDLQDHQARFTQLRTAVKNYEGDVNDLIEVAFDQSIRFDLGLLMEAQMRAEYVMRKQSSRHSHADSEEGDAKTYRWLDRVQRLQDRLAWLGEQYSKLQHRMRLAEPTVIKKDAKLEALRDQLRVLGRDSA